MSFGIALFFTASVSAQVKWTHLVDIPGMPTGAAPLGGYLIALYNFLLGAVGIIAMMMLIFGGFRYMTSAGNPAAMGDAKDIAYSSSYRSCFGAYLLVDYQYNKPGASFY